MKRTAMAAAVVSALGIGAAHASGPIGHWTLDEGKGRTIHDSIGRANGVISGAPTFVPGIAGSALSMHASSNDYVDLGNLATFDFQSQDFSVAVWVNFPVGTTADQYPLSNHRVGVNNGWIMFSGISGGCYGAAAKPSFYVSNSCGGQVTASTTIYDGGWHLLVGTCDNGVFKRIFVDGGPADATGGPATVAVHPLSRLVFGGLTDTSGNPFGAFTGLIDDIQIYDRVLNCAEVNFLVNNPGAEVGQVADFDLDGDVDGADLATLLGAWGPCGASCATDLDCSGSIDAADLAVVLGAWTG